MALLMSMTREALVERLTERLSLAKADDAREIQRHVEQEGKSLADFKRQLKSAMSWSWAELKKNDYHVSLGYSHRPSCPTPQTTHIQQALTSVKLDTRKSPFNFSIESDLGRAVAWEPKSKRAKKTLCD